MMKYRFLKEEIDAFAKSAGFRINSRRPPCGRYIDKFGVEMTLYNHVAGGLYLGRIHTPPLRRLNGYGGKALRRVLAVADHERIPMRLEVVDRVFDQDADALSPDELIQWYKRHGFEFDDELGGYPNMVRQPKMEG